MLKEFMSKEDNVPCVVDIVAGSHQAEATECALMIAKMILGFAKRCGLECEISYNQDSRNSRIIGMSIEIMGPFAYGHFKSERGIHRIVRTSPFDSKGRRHTTFTSVDVQCEAMTAEPMETARNYIFDPYARVFDPRANIETPDVHAVMAGDLDQFVKALLAKGQM